MKVLIFTLKWRDQLIDAQVVGGEDAYDRTIQVRYSRYARDPATGEEIVTFTRQQLESALAGSSERDLQLHLARFDAGRHIWIEREAWYMPCIGDLRAENVLRDVEV